MRGARTGSIDPYRHAALGYAMFIDALVASSSERSEATAQFRTLLEELAEPNAELPALLERSPRDGDGLNHYMGAIEAGLATGGNRRELLRSHEAWLAYRVFVRSWEGLDELVGNEPDGPGADVEHDGPPADVEPSEDETITTDELLRERPPEWGATEMRSLHVGLTEERTAFLNAEMTKMYAEMRELEKEK